MQIASECQYRHDFYKKDYEPFPSLKISVNLNLHNINLDGLNALVKYHRSVQINDEMSSGR